MISHDTDRLIYIFNIIRDDLSDIPISAYQPEAYRNPNMRGLTTDLPVLRGLLGRHRHS
jgi:hypothetical protein